MSVRFLLASIFCLFATLRVAASCPCAGSEEQVRLGFKQVARFAGKITTKFFVGGDEVQGTSRTYAAGSVGWDSSSGEYFAESYGCGQFHDTVFITAAIGQEITVVTTFVDDKTHADYTEIEGGVSIYTVLSMPSAECLDHYAALAGGEYRKVIPGFRRIAPEIEGNTIVDRYVSRPAGGDPHKVAGASAGPVAGSLRAVPKKPSYVDAQPLGDLCDELYPSAAFALAAADSDAQASDEGAARMEANDKTRGPVNRKSSTTSKGAIGGIRANPASGASVLEPWENGGSSGAPTETDFRPAKLQRGSARVRTEPVEQLVAATPAWLVPGLPGANLADKTTPKLSLPVRRQGSVAEHEAARFTADAAAGAPAMSTAGVSASSASPGSVVQAAVGALHFPIDLGYRQGRLLYVAPAINAQAYLPTALHLSQDANPLSVVRDSSGGLRQAWLPECFIDVQTFPAGFEIRVFPLGQIAAAENGLFDVSAASSLAVWRIENPEPEALVPDTVRFVGVRGGETTTHLARWQPASADHAGVMTVSFHDEAIIETRTYYLFSSPHARGERIQRSAGPLASPGPVVSDTYEVYREFYNWSEDGIIYEARTQRIDDPAGHALATTWVYFDVPGMAGNSLNGVIHPDGYWERYARYLDGRVAKVFRPFRDSPSHPSVATEGNSLVSHVTFSDTDDPLYEVEYRYDVLQAQVLTRREEIHRQILNNTFAETRVLSIDGASYEQSRSVRSGRGGLPVESYEASGSFSRFTYLDGRWDAESETFSDTGPGVPARRATERRGSRQQQGGIPDQTLVIVSVSDDEGRLLLEETYVHNGAAFVVGERSDWIGRTVRRYDSSGQLVRETRDGRVVYEAGHYADGRLAFMVDELGVRTDYIYDVFNRLSQTTRRRGTLSPDQVTTFQYDAADRLLFQTVSADGLSATTEYRYDLAGRRTHVITPDGLVETTSELRFVDANGAPVRRQVTVTAPSGATSITEFYRDRSLFRRHGTGATPEFWSYSYDGPSGFAIRLRYKQLTDSVPVYFSTTDWAGNLRQETSRTFGGSALFNRLYTYHGGSGAGNSVRGLLSRISTTGQADVLFEYDQLGRRSASGIDLNGNGILDRTGADPLSTYTTGYQREAADWFSFSREHRHLTVGADLATLRAETRDRLTGFGPGVVAERTTLDAGGRRTHQTVSLDRSSRTRVTTTRDLAAAPESLPEIRTEIGGLLRSLRRAGATAEVAFAYDGLDRLTGTDDPVSGAVTYGFDSLGRLETSTDSLQRETRFTYYPNGVVGAGQIATRQNAAGQVARFAYTERDQLHRQWGADTYPVEYAYDAQGRLVGLRTFRTDDAVIDWTQPTWPALGAITGDLTQWTYDYWSDLLEKKTYADGSVVRYNYDGSLRLAQRTNARGQITTYGYDTAGRLASVAYPPSSGTPGVTYGYDRAGRVSSITDGAGVRTLAYSPFDQLKSELHTTGLLSGIAVSREFDTANRLESLSLLDGTTTQAAFGYAYDNLSRLHSITHHTATGGPLAFTYGYTPGTGRWEAVTTARAGSTLALAERSFDGLGRITGTRFSNAAQAVLFSHDYQEFDASDRRKLVRREDGKEWAYDYNSRGEVVSSRKRFSAEEGGEWLAGWQATYAFDAIGNRTVTGAGGDASGGNLRPSVYTANSLNQYTQRSSTGSVFFTGEANPEAAVDVSVDEAAVGPVVRQGASGNRRFFAAEFLADNLTEPFHGTSRVRSTRSGEAPVGQVDWFYVPQTPELFSHDADGNLTSDDRWAYTWDAESRLIAMETRADRMLPLGVLPAERRMKLEFAYDSQSRRVRKQIFSWSLISNDWVLTKDTRYIYDGWNCIAELSVAGGSRSLATTRVWGLDLSGSIQGAGGVGGQLAMTVLGAQHGGDYLYAYDGNGNVVGLVQATDGTIAARYDYGAFGELLQSTGPLADLNTYRFSTKPQDETGLYYYGYRYYNPSTGRWLSRDPIEEEGGLNLLAFVAGDPVNFFDILGLMADGAGIQLWTEHCEKLRELYMQTRKLLGVAYDSYMEASMDLAILERVFSGWSGSLPKEQYLNLSGYIADMAGHLADIKGLKKMSSKLEWFGYGVDAAKLVVELKQADSYKKRVLLLSDAALEKARDKMVSMMFKQAGKALGQSLAKVKTGYGVVLAAADLGFFATDVYKFKDNVLSEPFDRVQSALFSIGDRSDLMRHYRKRWDCMECEIILGDIDSSN